MDKLGSIVFNFHSFVSADDFGSEINSSQSEGMCILLFKIQKFPNYVINMQIQSVHHWVMSDSLWPHGLQHTRPPCPSATPRVYPNSCSLSQWCHPAISSSVVPISSCLQSFPASGSFPMSQFFASGGQSIGVSPSVLPMNIWDWFPLGWTGWISLQSKGLSRVFSNTTVQNINSSALSLLYGPTVTYIHDYWICLYTSRVIHKHKTSTCSLLFQ